MYYQGPFIGSIVGVIANILLKETVRDTLTSYGFVLGFNVFDSRALKPVQLCLGLEKLLSYVCVLDLGPSLIIGSWMLQSLRPAILRK